MKIPPISPSALNLFLECGFKYRKLRLDNAYTEPQQVHSSRGDVLHKLIEVYMSTGIWAHEYAAPIYLEPDVIKAAAKDVTTWITEKQVRNFMEHVMPNASLEMMHAILMWATHCKEWKEDPYVMFKAGGAIPKFESLRAHMIAQPDCEMEINLDVHWQPIEKTWPPTHVSTCRIDMVVLEGTRAVIVDWKTGKHNPRFNSGELRQLRFCAAHILQKYPSINEVECFTYHMLEHPGTDTVKVYRDSPEHIGIFDYIMVMRKTIALYTPDARGDLFAKTEGGLCKNFCPVLECEHNGKSNKS